MLLVLSAVLLLSQCRKQKFITDPDAALTFSADTILFDTVFTTVGSTTRVLKLYNNHSQPITVSSIEIFSGNQSQFRINVDGISGYSHRDIAIDANDSLFIFVEVTVDPNSFDLPFIIEDSINFVTNGNHQSVKLHAWGQNAVFHGSSSSIYALGEDELVWDNNLPHVLYGVVAVDSAQTLTIYSGTQVYCHKGAGLWIYKSTLDIQGSLGNEVVFQGDRLEYVYHDEPGQWGIEFKGEYLSNQGIAEFTVTRGGLWFYQSVNSSIDYAIIKNGVVGIQVDSLDITAEHSLTITNTKVFNHSAVGIITQGADVVGSNNLFANCGQTCGLFTIGGEINLDFCTFSNYWSFGVRQAPTFVLRNYYEDINNVIQVRPFQQANFTNCVMYGNNADQDEYSEFIVDMYDQDDPLQQNFLFKDCWVDTENDLSADQFIDVHNQVVNFKNPQEEDFHLISDEYEGTPTSVSKDIEGNARSVPRVGCYEKNGE